MDEIVEENVRPEDLQKYAAVYNKQVAVGTPSTNAQFDYAWCLVRSKNQQDMRKGTSLLEDLFKRTADDQAKRDYLFYLAVGYTRLKEYEAAKKYAEAILKVQPGNHQVRELLDYINKKMRRDGLIGMAIVGGAAAVAAGGVAALLGVALSRK